MHIDRLAKLTDADLLVQEVGLSRSYFFTAIVIDKPTRVNRNSPLKDGLCCYITMLSRNGSAVGVHVPIPLNIQSPMT